MRLQQLQLINRLAGAHSTSLTGYGGGGGKLIYRLAEVINRLE